MDNPMISMIIPVYNVEKYIKKCVISAINQTYRRLEIILVDDGSTDRSGEICDEFARMDDRIRVIHKKNGGLSDARNAGLDIIKGEYVTFLDSDDFVTADYVEYLYRLITHYGACISACQPHKTGLNTKPIKALEEKVEKLDAISAMENFLYQRKFTASAYCKLYKREVFQKIRYPVGYYYEDFAIICTILDSISSFVVSNQRKYYYVQRDDSIMGRTFNPKKMHRIKIAEDVYGFIKTTYPQLTKAAEARCFLAAVHTFREIPLKQEYMTYVYEAYNEIKRYRCGVIADNKAKLSMRIIALSTYGGVKILKGLGDVFTKMRSRLYS